MFTDMPIKCRYHSKSVLGSQWKRRFCVVKGPYLFQFETDEENDGPIAMQKVAVNRPTLRGVISKGSAAPCSRDQRAVACNGPMLPTRSASLKCRRPMTSQATRTASG